MLLNITTYVLFITTHMCISVLFSGSDSSKLMKVVIYIYKWRSVLLNKLPITELQYREEFVLDKTVVAHLDDAI